MGLDLEHVHVYAQVPGTSEMRLMRTSPAMRFKVKDEPELWVQAGAIYAAGGKHIRAVPEWFWAEARKLSPEARKEVGLRLPEEGPVATVDEPKAPVIPSDDPVLPPKGASYEELAAYLGLGEDGDGDDEDEKLPPIPVPVINLWTCDECHEQVDTRKKGVHIAKHRRDAKRGGHDLKG